MSPSIKFTVFGKVRGKERARKGRYGNWYTPQRTKDYQELVGTEALVAIVNDNLLGHNLPDKERASVDMWPYRKGKRHPDSDNVEKLVLDALKGICYRDDNEVEGHCHLFQTGEDKMIVEVKWPERE